MEKYRESIELAEQITKYLKGKLSPEEEVELKKRLHDRPDGEGLLLRVRDEQLIAAKKEMYDSFNADKSWEKIRKVTGRRSSRMLYRVFRYAAIFVLPLAVAASIFFSNRSKQANHPRYIVDAYFESHKTMLELPGGVRIALDTTKNVTSELNDFGVTMAEGQGLDYSGLDSVMDAKVEYHKIVVPRGGEYNLKLADGTRVWMFAESEIRFPTRFKGSKREVYLSGEAYFEVRHDPAHPFYVKTKSLDVKVLGTSFNVKAYNNMDIVETSLVEGMVSLKDNVLRPNMQAVFHKNTGDFSYREINGESYR